MKIIPCPKLHSREVNLRSRNILISTCFEIRVGSFHCRINACLAKRAADRIQVAKVGKGLSVLTKDATETKDPQSLSWLHLIAHSAAVSC